MFNKTVLAYKLLTVRAYQWKPKTIFRVTERIFEKTEFAGTDLFLKTEELRDRRKIDLLTINLNDRICCVKIHFSTWKRISISKTNEVKLENNLRIYRE